MAYTNVSNEFKEIVKSNSITASAKIIFPNLNLTILPHATDNLKSSLADLTIYDKCCDNGKYIGNAVSKKVELSIINKDNLDLADREFELYVGVKLSSGEYEYIPYGNFIVTTYEDTKSNNKFKIEAYDYMTKLNGYFSNILYNEKTNPNGLKIDYPIKLKDFKEKILSYMKIDYVNQTLPNDNFDIKVEINFDGYTIRNVIAKIAELQGTFARINRENKMEFCLQTQTDEEIPLSSMNNKQEINNRYGPVNVVSLTMKNVKGENVTLRDDKSIDKYGENTIEIQDNPFVYTEALREKAIEELYSALDKFSYYPINFNWKARLYTDPSDIIKVYDMRNNEWVNSIVMNQTIKIPVTRQSTLESPALTKTQVANQYISQSKQANTRTEIIVDKQNQKIESVVNSVTEQNNKISQITQTVDEVNSKISDIADITTYGESDRAEVELTDVNESEPIMLKVHPTSTNISYLYPRENLYPSDLQYLPNRIIRFTRTYEEDGTTKTENIDYLLPDDLLRYSDTVYDEFYLDYDNQTCQVIKRCAYNADGTVRALGTEITTDYPYPTITLGEGNYTITLPGYDFGYLYVRLMAKNIYTTQFYTKVETDSRISQKADEINLEVSKKVGNDEIISKINQSAEKVQISATKLDLKGYATFSDLSTSGKTTINGDNITTGTIKSKNYAVDENGNATAGTQINLTNGIIDSKNFTLDSKGNVNVSGLLTTGKGIYTNLHTVGALYQRNNLSSGMDFFGIMENNYGGKEDITKTQLCFFIYVPTGFVVEEAYINLTIIPIKWKYLGKQYWGYARNIGLYKGEIPDSDTARYASEAYSTTYNIGTKIDFLSDSSNWKPENDKTLSTNHKKVSKTSKNISSEITTGNNFLIIQTDNNPSISDDMHELAEQTGKALGFLDIYGYLPR